MDAHPAADLFPMMADSEVVALAADIKANGMRQPIVTIEEGGKRLVLDGRNRFRACAMAGVEPVLIPFEGGDPFALVVSANLQRRHMSQSQRAMVAESLAKMKQGSNQHAQNCASSDSASQEDAAKLLKVSRRNVQKARRVKGQCVPELVAAVVAGEVSVNAAHEVAGLPAEEQRSLLAGGAKAIVQAKRVSEHAAPTRAIFLHDGTAAKPVRDGVVRVRPLVEQATDPRRHHDSHDLVRSLTEQGYSASDIQQQTGLKQSFVFKSRKSLRTPSVLGGAMQDAELFAESWASRADTFDARWASAPREEKRALIAALVACRASAQRVINRLNKEAKGESVHEAFEDQAQ